MKGVYQKYSALECFEDQLLTVLIEVNSEIMAFAGYVSVSELKNFELYVEKNKLDRVLIRPVGLYARSHNKTKFENWCKAHGHTISSKFIMFYTRFKMNSVNERKKVENVKEEKEQQQQQ